MRHRFWYGVSERVGWSRGTHYETPAGQLTALTREQSERIAALRSRYQVQFELQLSAATSVNNYEYLDILDRAWTETRMVRPAGGVLCDVGCASFWYAAALQAFFRPADMMGVEIEGHRLYRDGHTRIDYARGYLAGQAHSEFVIADYTGFGRPADVITAWFPFLTPASILAWRLPLSLLAPAGLFRRIRQNLRPGGLFMMVNHGLDEAALAQELCIAAGLLQAASWAQPGVLSRYRARPAVLSCWRTA